jgi:hypothetical protein
MVTSLFPKGSVRKLSIMPYIRFKPIGKVSRRLIKEKATERREILIVCAGRVLTGEIPVPLERLHGDR